MNPVDLTTSPPPTAIAPAAPAFFNASNQFRVTACPVCGVAFALPLHLYIRRCDGGHIFCPGCGGTIPLQKHIDDPHDMLALNAAMLAELTQARHELERARDMIAGLAATDRAAMQWDEIERRINVLVGRADEVGRGRRCCRLCGKDYHSPYDLKQHFRRKHGGQIAAMEAGVFG